MTARKPPVGHKALLWYVFTVDGEERTVEVSYHVGDVR